MEKNISVKTQDGYKIYGVLNTPKKKSARLIIFVHGLTGHANEHLFYNAARFFTERGFATFRIELYSGKLNSRLLTNSSLSTHLSDIGLIVKYFRKKFSSISLVGHSFGGLSILLSKADVESLVLWDATCNVKGELIKEFDSFVKFNRKLNKYVLTWGAQYLLGKKFMDEFYRIPYPKRIMKDVTAPVKVIVAGKGELVKGGKEYFKYANSKKQLKIIKGAGHCFDEEGSEEKLFYETLRWLKAIL